MIEPTSQGVEWMPVTVAHERCAARPAGMQPAARRRERTEGSEKGPEHRQPRALAGIDASAGCAHGHVHLLRPAVPAPEAGVVADIPAEIERLRRAMTGMRGRISAFIEANLGAGLDGRNAVVEAYQLFSESPDWMDRLEAAVGAGQTAARAVTTAQAETRARFERIGDPCLRDWLSDLDLLANELLRDLLGVEGGDCVPLEEDAVIVARNIGAREVFCLAPRVRAFVIEEGSDTAPAAIVAASMGIPMVVGVGGIASVARQGDRILVDGDGGAVVVRPGLRLVQIDGTGGRRVRDLPQPEPGRFAGPCDRPQAFGGADQPAAWIVHALGPVPDQSLRAMIGYGLTDREMARYYGLEEADVAHVRRIYGIGIPSAEQPITERDCIARMSPDVVNATE